MTMRVIPRRRLQFSRDKRFMRELAVGSHLETLLGTTCFIRAQCLLYREALRSA